MALRRFLVSNGFSRHQADSMLGLPSEAADGLALTAAGTNFATAYALNTYPGSISTFVFTTTAASTGTRLPPMEVGDEVDIVNLGANALLLYPDAGGSFNSGAADATFSVAAAKAVRIKKISATKNIAFLSA